MKPDFTGDCSLLVIAEFIRDCSLLMTEDYITYVIWFWKLYYCIKTSLKCQV